MARKLQQILLVLGIGGASLFQVGGCDTLASSFLEGVQSGYTGVTGTNLFEDIGKELAGGFGSTDGTTPSTNSSWGGGSPYAYAYSGFQPNYYGW